MKNKPFPGHLKGYVVIYRKGGKDNFSWHRVSELFPNNELAYQKQCELERMGYRALIHDLAKLDSMGMPETFD